MAKIIDRRKNPLNAVELPLPYSCAFTGAYYAGLVMENCGIVTHCSPGCNFSLYISGTGASARFSRNHNLVSTMLNEKNVIMGGDEILYKTLVEFAEKKPSDFQLLIAGCAPSITGDDIKESAERAFKKTGIPVVAVNAGGFKGTTIDGYNYALNAFAESRFLDMKEKEEKTVNLLGIIPVHDIFWKGNIEEINRLLQKIGIRVNITFIGDRLRFQDFINMTSAKMNVIVSDSIGYEAAQILQRRFDMEYVSSLEGYPIGTVATKKFLRSVAEKMGVNSRIVDSVVEEEEKQFRMALSDYEGAVKDVISRHRYFLFADSYYALGIFNFLTGEMGMTPAGIGVSSSTDSTFEILRSMCERFNVDPFIAIDPDNADLKNIAEQSNPTFLIGRGEDFHLANLLGIPFLGIAPTHIHRINTSSMPLIGYRGALHLIDEMFREIARA
ncbi:MAG: hypothetical protein D6734_00860 [Candidatus Schekmanbacteria bacterium]|nr:MAG: hypothetical protein D6734_00860 [Candidatus Schekmanbacteria bacterium]